MDEKRREEGRKEGTEGGREEGSLPMRSLHPSGRA